MKMKTADRRRAWDELPDDEKAVERFTKRFFDGDLRGEIAHEDTVERAWHLLLGFELRVAIPDDVYPSKVRSDIKRAARYVDIDVRTDTFDGYVHAWRKV